LLNEFAGVRPHVLVVDDYEQNREILSIYLEDMEVDVSEAESGEQALTQLSEHRFDLVLLDILMPGLTGQDVLKAMKANPDMQEVSVIMCSALTDTETVVACLQLGAEDYVSKPFDRFVLEARVNGCLERKLLRDRERNVTKQLEASQQLLQIELDDAANYMRSLLPAPLTEPVKTHWIFKPCSNLGGDSFGYQWLDDDTFVFYLLDVSGHGVGSALFSASITDWLRVGSLHQVDFTQPDEVAVALNHAFPMVKHDGKYFTIWYAVYHVSTQKIRYCCCGHPPSLLFRDGVLSALSGDGAAINGFEQDYEVNELDIQAGDRILLFSDGIYELPGEDGIIMGYADFIGIMNTLNKDSLISIEHLVEHFQSANFGQFLDDVSLLEITL